MREHRIYRAVERSVGLHRALSFHQLSAAGRDLENRVNSVVRGAARMDPALKQEIVLIQ
jgi:hypothetical protein